MQRLQIEDPSGKELHLNVRQADEINIHRTAFSILLSPENILTEKIT
jgi:hypothetical protein